MPEEIRNLPEMKYVERSHCNRWWEWHMDPVFFKWLDPGDIIKMTKIQMGYEARVLELQSEMLKEMSKALGK